MQLYNLTANYQQIADYIDSAEELDESLLIDTWESIDEAFEDKVISTAYVIKNNVCSSRYVSLVASYFVYALFQIHSSL